MNIVLPRAGELTRRISIKLWSDVPNGAFGLNQTFDAGIKRFAKREPVAGLYIRAGVQTGEEPTDRWWVYYGAGTKPTDITAAHVVEHNGRRYRVLGCEDLDDSRLFTSILTKDLGAI